MPRREPEAPRHPPDERFSAPVDGDAGLKEMGQLSEVCVYEMIDR